MKVVRERLDEIKKSEDTLSSLSAGNAEQILGLIRGTYGQSAISRGREIDIKKSDDAYILYHTIATAFGSSNPNVIDVVQYNSTFTNKDVMDFVYVKLMKLTSGETLMTSISDDNYKIRMGKRFAIVWNIDYEDKNSLGHFYVFVDNRYIRL
jgi:hypothetical protein